MNYTVDIRVKRTLVFYLSWHLINIMFLIRVIKNEQELIKWINTLILNDKTFKYKVTGSRWRKLDMSNYFFEVEEVKK